MGRELERRWDDAMEQDWRAFRSRVADRLAALADGEQLIVELPQEEALEGAMPYCQVAADDGWLRVEAVSNEFLDDDRLLDAGQEDALAALGFAAPDDERSPNHWADLEQRKADRASVMVVRAMREVYGVLHPVYLSAGGLEPAGPPTDGDGSADEAAVPDEPTPAEGPHRLRTAVAAALAPLIDGEPTYDEDGDLPIETRRCVLWVTVAERLPRLLMHAGLVVDVVDEAKALEEVNLLNRKHFGLTFVLADRRVSVRRELPVDVLVPEQLRREARMMLEQLDDWTTELTIRLGGRGAHDEEPAQPDAVRDEAREADDPRFDRALRVLRELEQEERGSVDAATMVRIFDRDRELLLRAIAWARHRAGRWGSRQRGAAREGKSSYARLCRAQQRYHHELRRRLRAALRLAVEATPSKERAEQLQLFSDDEAS